MILQFLHQSLNIPDVAHSCLHFGYLIQYGNVLCNLLIRQPERHISFIVFHINDHSIQFRLIHQSDQLLHSGAAGLRTGDIDAFHFRPVRHAVRSSKLLPRRRGRSRCRFIRILRSSCGCSISTRDIRCRFPGSGHLSRIHRCRSFYSITSYSIPC